MLTFQSVDDAWEKIDYFASKRNAIVDELGCGDKTFSRSQGQKAIAECDELMRKIGNFGSRLDHEVESFDAASDYRLTSEAVEALNELLSLKIDLLTYRSRFI